MIVETTQIEAYAPQKGLRNQYTATLEQPWRELVVGAHEHDGDEANVQRISIDPNGHAQRGNLPCPNGQQLQQAEASSAVVRERTDALAIRA